jgi:hypothetical protein
MAKTDGGPAFPEARGGGVTPGMTLRDYFAGQAIAGFMPGAAVDDSYVRQFARRAYQVADAMIEARDAGK